MGTAPTQSPKEKSTKTNTSQSTSQAPSSLDSSSPNPEMSNTIVEGITPSEHPSAGETPMPTTSNFNFTPSSVGEGFAQIQSTPTQVDTDIDSPSSTPFIGAQQARITESFSSYTEDTLVFQDAEENIASMSSDENSTIPSRQPPDSQQQPEVINTQSTISPAGTLVTSSGHHIQLGTPKDVPEMEVTQIDSETSSEDEHIGLRTRSKLQQKPESPRQSGTPTEGMTSAGLRRSARLNPHLAQSNHDQNL